LINTSALSVQVPAASTLHSFATVSGAPRVMLKWAFSGSATRANRTPPLPVQLRGSFSTPAS